MGLFQKKIASHLIVAQQTGKIIPLTEVPDPVFSGKVLGDGIGIIPAENKVVAPISGTIVQIADTLHAICIEGDDGLEVLVHLGLETVKLKGKGFTCHVKTGQHVLAGDLIMEMDIQQIQQAGLNVVTPCVISNMDKVQKFTIFSGNTEAGETAIMEYELS